MNVSYGLLAEQSAVIHQKYPEAKTEEDEAWEGSPFDWFRKKPSATKGKIGRDLAAFLIETSGFAVSRVGMGLEAEGKTIRVKLSLMWGAGSLTFEQIKDDPFDYLLCLGLYPGDSYGWFIPKKEMIVDGDAQDRDGFSGQHVQPGEKPSDFWLQGLDPLDPHEWLKEYGGTTDKLIKIIQKTLG
jgi:hypothetical protein